MKALFKDVCCWLLELASCPRLTFVFNLHTTVTQFTSFLSTPVQLILFAPCLSVQLWTDYVSQVVSQLCRMQPLTFGAAVN